MERAKEKAQAQNLQIDFQKHDARNLPFKNKYDLAIMLCEGVFPYSALLHSNWLSLVTNFDYLQIVR